MEINEKKYIPVSKEDAELMYKSGILKLKELALKYFNEKELKNVYPKTVDEAYKKLGFARPIASSDIDDMNMVVLSMNKPYENMNGFVNLYYPKFKLEDVDDKVSVGEFDKQPDYIAAMYDNKFNMKTLWYNGVGVIDSFKYVPMEIQIACTSKDAAEWMGKRFGKLIFDALYKKKYQYTWSS